MTLADIKKVRYGSVLFVPPDNYYVVIGVLHKLSYIAMVAVSGKKLTEKHLFKEIDACEIKCRPFFELKNERVKLCDQDFSVFVTKLKMMNWKFELFTIGNLNNTIAQELNICFGRSELQPLHTYSNASYTRHFDYVYNNEAVELYTKIKLEKDDMFFDNGIILPHVIRSDGKVGSYISIGYQFYLVKRKRFNKYTIVQCDGRNNILDFFGENIVITGKELSRQALLQGSNCLYDAYSEELIQLMIKYEEQLRNVFLQG